MLIFECIRQLDTANKSALFVAHERHVGSITLDQRDPLLAHPIGHEYMNRIAKCMPDRRERDTGVAARRLGDDVAFADLLVAICRADDVEGHSILDAAGQIQVLGLCKDRPAFAFVMKMHSEQRRIADQIFDVTRTSRDRTKMILKFGEAGGIHMQIHASLHVVLAYHF